MLTPGNAPPARLHPHQAHPGIPAKGRKQTNRIRAAAHTGNAFIRQAPSLRQNLLARLNSNHRLEIAAGGVRISRADPSR